MPVGSLDFPLDWAKEDWGKGECRIKGAMSYSVTANPGYKKVRKEQLKFLSKATLTFGRQKTSNVQGSEKQNEPVSLPRIGLSPDVGLNKTQNLVELPNLGATPKQSPFKNQQEVDALRARNQS